MLVIGRDHFVAHQCMQVLVEDFMLLVGKFLEVA
jgi:hypothetical protein